MSTSAIADCCISSLEHPITALADRPALSAEDLKAYFDANPLQLMHAHNALAQALTDSAGAKNIGFTGTAGVSASNVQQAIEQVQQQLSDLSAGSVPDGSITTAKLAASLQQQIHAITQLQTTVEQLQAEQHASGTQFPFMVLALSDDTPETMLDELASAARSALHRRRTQSRQAVRLAVHQKQQHDSVRRLSRQADLFRYFIRCGDPAGNCLALPGAHAYQAVRRRTAHV